MTALASQIRDAYVIRKDEDVAPLCAALVGAGLNVREVRGPYGAEMAAWSANTLCMVNHRNAWAEIEASGRIGLVVEADFVPVRGFGQLMVPLGWSEDGQALAYLYACGPQLWDLSGGLRGHAGGGVAYLVSPRIARKLIEFADSEILAVSPEKYMGWDARVGFWLNDRGIETFLPYRNYGEHGGVPNPEHRRAGLRATHRADVLAGPLAFLPAYARGSRVRYAWTRARARGWGLVRLFAGRYLAWRDFARSPEKKRLLRVAIGRHLFRRPPADWASPSAPTQP